MTAITPVHLYIRRCNSIEKLVAIRKIIKKLRIKGQPNANRSSDDTQTEKWNSLCRFSQIIGLKRIQPILLKGNFSDKEARTRPLAKKIPRQSDWITVPSSCMPSSFKVTTLSSDVAHVHVDPGRVGRVVMQRIANPCTPVRFRYPPPIKIIAKNINILDT